MREDQLTRIYEAEFERVCERLLQAGKAEGCWRQGVQAAMASLAEGVSERPLLAHSLTVGVHRAGAAVLAKRDEILERLFRAIEGARSESDPLHDPPPGITAPFMIGAIESSVAKALEEGRPQAFAVEAPALAELVIGAYFEKS